MSASIKPNSGVITIYENGDLIDDPDWLGVDVDFGHELGHRVAEELWGQYDPLDQENWFQAS